MAPTASSSRSDPTATTPGLVGAEVGAQVVHALLMEGGNSGGERARAENNGYTGENTNMTTTTKDGWWRRQWRALIIVFVVAVEMDVDEEKPQREKETSNTAVGGDVVGNGVSSGESGASGEGPKVSRNPAADCDSGAKGEDEEKSEQEKRLWSTVTTNPSDFTSWTSLLQLTEQKVRNLLSANCRPLTK